MKYIMSVVFVALLRDKRYPESNQLMLCTFAKRIPPPENAPQPGEIMNVAGVLFRCGTPRRTSDATGYIFEPVRMRREERVLTSEFARILTTEDNKKFVAVRDELNKRGYQLFVSDLAGNLLFF